MTPLTIDIGLWYYCRCGDYGKGSGDRNFDADAVQEAIKNMVEAGLLTRRTVRDDEREFGAEYVATDGLTLWVQTLCGVPWPKQKWVMP